jgi:hypothetical protein
MSNRAKLDELLTLNPDLKFDSKRFDTLKDKDQKKLLKMLSSDASKGNGTYKFTAGVNTNFDSKGTAGVLNKAKAMVNHTIGPSAVEAYANSFGFMTSGQRAMSANSSMLGKLSYKAIPAFGAFTALSGAVDGEDPFEYVGEQMAFGGATQGYRLGSTLGTSTMGRFGAGLVGGAFIGAAVYGGFAAAKDLSSNTSSIAKAAKKMYTKELSVASFDNDKTLTMRQAALSKLSNSAINDRGLLLGNEAMILRGSL